MTWGMTGWQAVPPRGGASKSIEHILIICDLPKRVKGNCEKLHQRIKKFRIATRTTGKVQSNRSLREIPQSQRKSEFMKAIIIEDSFERFCPLFQRVLELERPPIIDF